MTVAIVFIAMVSTAQQNGTFTDIRDDKTYKTVKIGTQTWMAENLAYKTSGGCWAYDNKAGSVETFGYLYDWETAKNVCPEGWHLPGDDEWTELTGYTGGTNDAGGKLKAGGTIEAGTGLWHEPNTGATNQYGFTALPGGRRDLDGQFNYIDSYGYWWTATENNTNTAFSRSMFFNYGGVLRNPENKEFGFSVRCLKN